MSRAAYCVHRDQNFLSAQFPRWALQHLDWRTIKTSNSNPDAGFTFMAYEGESQNGTLAKGPFEPTGFTTDGISAFQSWTVGSNHR